jgi:hypothetical protein
VIGAGQGTVPVLGGGQELAVPFQDSGQHGQRLASRGGRGGQGGWADPFGLCLVVPGQFGRGPGAGHGVGAFG